MVRLIRLAGVELTSRAGVDADDSGVDEGDPYADDPYAPDSYSYEDE